jgi:hypothetical protein
MGSGKKVPSGIIAHSRKPEQANANPVSDSSKAYLTLTVSLIWHVSLYKD